jgi:hypothetical protein
MTTSWQWLPEDKGLTKTAWQLLPVDNALTTTAWQGLPDKDCLIMIAWRRLPEGKGLTTRGIYDLRCTYSASNRVASWFGRKLQTHTRRNDWVMHQAPILPFLLAQCNSKLKSGNLKIILPRSCMYEHPHCTALVLGRWWGHSANGVTPDNDSLTTTAWQHRWLSCSLKIILPRSCMYEHPHCTGPRTMMGSFSKWRHPLTRKWSMTISCAFLMLCMVLKTSLKCRLNFDFKQCLISYSNNKYKKWNT